MEARPRSACKPHGKLHCKRGWAQGSLSHLQIAFMIQCRPSEHAKGFHVIAASGIHGLDGHDSEMLSVGGVEEAGLMRGLFHRCFARIGLLPSMATYQADIGLLRQV